MAVLEDLAADAEFDGIVLCSVWEEWLDESVASDQEYLADAYDNLSPVSIPEAVAVGLVQSQFVTFRRESNFRELVKSFVLRRMPPRDARSMAFSRDTACDFSVVDIPKLRLKQEGGPIADLYRKPLGTTDHYQQGYQRVHEAAEAIRQRGGEVWFLRLPTSGWRWKMDQLRHPRDEYWDRFSRIEENTIHFKDLEAIASLDLPDYSHVDYRDRPLLMKTFVDEIRARGGFSDLIDTGGTL
ncbi:hypothetical protein [Roseiconus lacunae]|uniref:Uncharacterized protein n=1 Tax=Roseiconus lacunae TaxID=2605694 RepID=A0ABT7PRA4_9BACT|nr:hypothetical protein [Roseiconus lacunae]MDM4018848.1 hypothetical protein [Roseiconus lacunae]